ncbi:MAG: protein translocase subunit SecF [Gammaproteobacteria bacterium]|nr:protein translocase subunit SecF [Gammaproteobacteria bacterium]NIR97922.1 protein translocase subunit SecF [Gammaproteobacteria bacterium]NIT63627.1 protein translocase subunit SecF [Gammaproteobacteria bacterium]NIV20563.1 protein translocase subunit SecF [Gammaproteobacteria bacterium]NIX11157.1 protein translocase subunit SecF [Gammaproteobacteria bacterium]
MEIIKAGTRINFMGVRNVAVSISLALVLAAVVSLFARGLNFGIDFTGGTLVEVGYPAAVELDSVREALADGGFDKAVVQHFGTTRDVLVRVAPRVGVEQSEISAQVLRAMRAAADDQIDHRRTEFVGPQVGEELTEKGGLAMLYALFGILIYITLRFEYRFSVGSVAALVHDVLITLGVFSLLQIPFDLTVLAALLAVIGYSLNDTIVVFDRIRENFRKMRKADPVTVVNTSINQTLARTLMTSLTTLLVLLALFFLGGEVIHGFALALIIGVVVGTYSSIYVASTAALMLGVSRADLMPVKKEGAEADNRP